MFDDDVQHTGTVPADQLRWVEARRQVGDAYGARAVTPNLLDRAVGAGVAGGIAVQGDSDSGRLMLEDRCDF